MENRRPAMFWGVVIFLLSPLSSNFCDGYYFEPTSYDEVQPSDLIYLFHRPTEPVLTLRGLYREAIFDIPLEYLPERYKKLHDQISLTAKFGSVRRIPIKRNPVRTELLETTSTLAFDELFIPNDPPQGNVTLQFFYYFIDQKTIADFLSAAVWSRLHFNPEMVLEAVRQAILFRKDTQTVQTLEQVQYITDQYVDDSFFAKAREQMWLYDSEPSQRAIIPVFRNGTREKGGEDDMWFFLEDPGLSLLHFHWHLIYPYSGAPWQVIKNRRGELFMYFHRQMIARLNANRFNLKLERVQALSFTEPVRQGYFPHMLVLQTSTCYTQRPANTTTEGVNIPEIERWIANVKEAIQQGHAVRPNGTIVPLRGKKGMDVVENMLEGVPLLSPNFDLYGDVHNNLHPLVANNTSPWGLYTESQRVVETLYALRDPAFFNIHQLMDDLYEDYKLTLTPYEREELEFPSISVTSVRLESDRSKAVNQINRFWLLTDVDVATGLQYTAPGPLFARFQRLVHEPFHYEIKVTNTGAEAKIGFVRLFLLIQDDERGEPVDLRTMQRYSIELDRFKAFIPPGESVITRDASESSVTIDPDVVYQRQKTYQGIRSVNHCRCGMPMSLLVPRGTEAGQRYKLFVLITDYTQDGIDPSEDEICREGWSLCGARETPYPDRRPMGYPFDRKFADDVKSLEEFLTDNMATQDVVIKFNDEIQGPSQFLSSGTSTSWKP